MRLAELQEVGLMEALRQRQTCAAHGPDTQTVLALQRLPLAMGSGAIVMAVCARCGANLTGELSEAMPQAGGAA